MKDNMVLVFKTSVSANEEVKQLRPLLNKLIRQNGDWNFDLEDCDNILRVETQLLKAENISTTLHNQGFYCEELLFSIKRYLHLCEIIEVIPEKKLTYSWRYDGYEGNSFVTFEVFEEGDETRLKLTHRGLESFPNNPDFARTNFEMGWDQIINTSLKEYLSK